MLVGLLPRDSLGAGLPSPIPGGEEPPVILVWVCDLGYEEGKAFSSQALGNG